MLSVAVDNLVSDLKLRHKEVIVNRFGIVGGGRLTLADLGERYGVSRERIRQIESEALNDLREKLKEEKDFSREILDVINRHLKSVGGLRRDDLFVREIKTILRDENLHHWHLRLISEIVGWPSYYPSDEHFHHFWYLDEKDVAILKKFVNFLENLIADKKENMFDDGEHHFYLIKAAKKHGLPDLIGSNYASVSKKFGVNPFGDFGLDSWDEINPKTMRAKAYLILKKSRKPMHFTDISDAINRYGFNRRRALPQTVHNELIKDPKIVLVGRGTYGLKERGYFPGTAKEVIRTILKKEGPLPARELFDRVSRQRILKDNTVLLNLQNKKYFRKLADGRYSAK